MESLRQATVQLIPLVSASDGCPAGVGQPAVSFADGLMGGAEQRICAMRAEGFSVGRSPGVGFVADEGAPVLMASPAIAAVAAVPADPIVALLTEADMAHLGSAGDVVGGLTALERYRVLCLPAGSAAGDAARALFDHGRGGDAWREWLHAGQEPVPVAGDPMPAHVRDGRIVELRREGWSLAQIADALSMTKGGVSRALDRIYDGRPGQQPRGSSATATLDRDRVGSGTGKLRPY